MSYVTLNAFQQYLIVVLLQWQRCVSCPSGGGDTLMFPILSKMDMQILQKGLNYARHLTGLDPGPRRVHISLFTDAFNLLLLQCVLSSTQLYVYSTF